MSIIEKAVKRRQARKEGSLETSDNPQQRIARKPEKTRFGKDDRTPESSNLAAGKSNKLKCPLNLDGLVKDGYHAPLSEQKKWTEEYRLIKDNPYADKILNIFNIGHIEYGRIDFGLVENKIETYEINTNPYVSFTRKHPYPIRIESGNLSKKLYEDAMAEINTPDTNQKIEIISVRSAFKDLRDSPPFTQHRRIP